MSGTAKYTEPTQSAASVGPWVLLQAWPEAAIIPFPIAGSALGRDHLAQFTQPDDQISTAHCRLSHTPRGVAIEDLGSTNGTYVDGCRITSATLAEGQILRIGGTIFVARRSPLREPAPPIAGGPGGDLHAPFGLTALRRALERLDAHGDNILITGPTGSGKEALAHHVAARRGRAHPFAAVNAAAYRNDSFDAAFFGYERGAFTGALVRHEGIVAAARGGTLFLDEIGDMPVAFQPLLLRFLEMREVRPIGSTRTAHADVLVIAATHRNLDAATDDGTFREDLRARFGAHLHLPALRDRPEDIPSVARALAARAGWSLDETADVTAVEYLMRHPHPQNARGLRRLLTEAHGDGVLRADLLQAIDPLPPAIPEADAIRTAVATHGSERAAARALGISRRQIKRAATPS